MNDTREAEAQPVIAELLARMKRGWTGGVRLDFKDGHIKVREERQARGEKQRNRVD